MLSFTSLNLTCDHVPKEKRLSWTNMPNTKSTYHLLSIWNPLRKINIRNKADMYVACNTDMHLHFEKLLKTQVSI